MSPYCDIARQDPLHRPYHDREYGRPLADDRALFERLCLEIFQAGLSWGLVLRKRAGLDHAFSGFEPAAVARFGEAERQRLLADPRVIRNRRKIDGVIENAGRLEALVGAEGSFAAWLDRHHPRTLDAWVSLFRGTFVFVGPEVVREFLVSTGYLPGAHAASCPVYAEIAALRPAWMRAHLPRVP